MFMTSGFAPFFVVSFFAVFLVSAGEGRPATAESTLVRVDMMDRWMEIGRARDRAGVNAWPGYLLVMERSHKTNTQG